MISRPEACYRRKSLGNKKDCCTQQSSRKENSVNNIYGYNVNLCQIFPYTPVNGIFGPEQNREDHRS